MRSAHDYEQYVGLFYRSLCILQVSCTGIFPYA